MLVLFKLGDQYQPHDQPDGQSGDRYATQHERRGKFKPQRAEQYHTDKLEKIHTVGLKDFLVPTTTKSPIARIGALTILY